MTCFQLIFSPTGGTERVAKALTETWPEVQTIDLSAQNFTAPAIPFSADDLVLIAMPAFEAMAPQPALDRLALLQGNGARCALAAVYGNRAVDNTLAQMEDYARNAGFQPIATVSAVAAHSLLPEFAAGRPDDADCQQLAAFGKQILEKFTSGSDTCPPIPGEHHCKAKRAGLIPTVNANCTLPADSVHGNAPWEPSPTITSPLPIRPGALPVCAVFPAVRFTPGLWMPPLLHR